MPFALILIGLFLVTNMNASQNTPHHARPLPVALVKAVNDTCDTVVACSVHPDVYETYTEALKKLMTNKNVGTTERMQVDLKFEARQEGMFLLYTMFNKIPQAAHTLVCNDNADHAALEHFFSEDQAATAFFKLKAAKAAKLPTKPKLYGILKRYYVALRKQGNPDFSPLDDYKEEEAIPDRRIALRSLLQVERNIVPYRITQDAERAQAREGKQS